MRHIAYPLPPNMRMALLLVLTALPVSRFASAEDGACQPVYDSMDRLAATPNHQWISQSKSGSHDKPTAVENITVGGSRYLQMSSGWVRMPFSTAQTIKEQAE